MAAPAIPIATINPTHNPLSENGRPGNQGNNMAGKIAPLAAVNSTNTPFRSP